MRDKLYMIAEPETAAVPGERSWRELIERMETNQRQEKGVVVPTTYPRFITVKGNT